MTDDNNDPLRLLEREAEPPTLLKARVMRTLRQSGVLKQQRRGWGLGLGVAAAVATFALGVALGRPNAAPADTRPTFALLLYEDTSFRYDRPESEFVAEYSAWAGELASRGALVSGEKLDSTSRLLQEGAQVRAADARSDLGVLAGFFIIRADSEAEALRIAESCPHLNHGGRIALRPIVRT